MSKESEVLKILALDSSKTPELNYYSRDNIAYDKSDPGTPDPEYIDAVATQELGLETKSQKSGDDDKSSGSAKDSTKTPDPSESSGSVKSPDSSKSSGTFKAQYAGKEKEAPKSKGTSKAKGAVKSPGATKSSKRDDRAS